MADRGCPNTECKLAENGKCVEGFEDISECPHQKRIEFPEEGVLQTPDSEKQVARKPQTELESKDIAVASGEILSIDAAADVLRVGPTRVMTVVGPLDSGKTTFGLSLYSAFHDGPFGRWSFSGSLTLPAFEQRCHDSRAVSRRIIADTRRTSLPEGLGFLHLAVHSNETGRIDLLISDRAGEYYTAVANSEESCKSLHELSRADYVLFMLDGEKLTSDERHGVKHDLSMMIESLLRGGVLGPNHKVAIVLTKYDYVASLDHCERIESEFNGFVDKIRTRFDGQLGEVNRFKIAARRENDCVDDRYGILELLDECMRPQVSAPHKSTSERRLERAFHRLRIR